MHTLPYCLTSSSLGAANLYHPLLRLLLVLAPWLVAMTTAPGPPAGASQRELPGAAFRPGSGLGSGPFHQAAEQVFGLAKYQHAPPHAIEEVLYPC